MNIFNGVIIDENPDPRNFTVSQFVPGEDKIKDTEFMLKLPKLDFIIDQGEYSACVGHSYAMAKSILEYQQSNKWIDIDPFMIYGTRFEGDYVGVGMHPYQGAKALYKEGAFLRRNFNKRQEMPQIKDTVESWKKKNPELVKSAKELQITGYGYCYTNEQIKKSLKAGMPVSCCYPIYSSFYKTGLNGMVPSPSGSLEGYHQMLIVGWTSNRWIVINSWGSRFGLKGMYLIPFSNQMDSSICVTDKIIPSRRKAGELIFTIGKTEYTVDGEKMTLDSVPYIKNDRTYLPIRFVTESLGCSVEWDQNTNTALIRSEEADIKLKIGSKNINVNNWDYSMDVAPEVVNDRTMIPVRFVSEYLNCSVTWDKEKQDVIIKAL